MATAIAILMGHGRQEHTRFEVSRNMHVHFLWKSFSTFNDPGPDAYPKVIWDAMKGTINIQTVKTNDRFEAVYGPGAHVNEHVLKPYEMGGSGTWNPDVVALDIPAAAGKIMPISKLALADGLEIRRVEDHAKQVLYLLVYVKEGQQGKPLSDILKALRQYCRDDDLQVYWWACRSPGGYVEGLASLKWFWRAYVPFTKKVPPQPPVPRAKL